jgi:hypothetical protein
MPPSHHFLPIENCGDGASVQFEKTVIDLLRRGNLAQAEILVRTNVMQFGDTAKALNFLGWIASALDLVDPAAEYFTQAAQAAPAWRLPQINLERLRRSAAEHARSAPQDASNRFLLVKAWGYGFWSDVSHVIGQLLIAELTHRTPIVHWGSNSLFGNGTASNAFDVYFDPVSQVTIDDLRSSDLRIWPPKWTHSNLLEGALNQWQGPYSRIAGIYLLEHEEEILVSDFFTSILDLRPWIPRQSPLYGMSVDELHTHFLQKYLRPKPEIIEAVDTFHASRLAAEDYLAVHARGSDKIEEFKNLDALNLEYRQVIDEFRAGHRLRRIFLLTDDSRLQGLFSSWYGGDVISTDCLRTTTSKGIHYQATSDRRQLGREVLIDAYLAVRGKAFVGNGMSNPSLIVHHLKAWPEGTARLIGPNMYHIPNTFLHNW